MKVYHGVARSSNREGGEYKKMAEREVAPHFLRCAVLLRSKAGGPAPAPPPPPGAGARAALFFLFFPSSPPPGGGGGGEGGIRTLGTLLAYTHFPGVLLKPLGHLSGDKAWRHAPKRDARVNYRLLLRNKAIRQRGKVRPNHRAAPRPRTPAGSAGMPPHSCDYRSGRRQHSDALNRVRGP